MKNKTRRYGAHEVKEGPYKGAIHVATKRWYDFSGQLNYLTDYLTRRVIPLEVEESMIRNMLINIQNILEYNLEGAIEHYTNEHHILRNIAFVLEMRNDFVSFTRKIEWAKKKGLLSEEEKDLLEEIRDLRNEYAHLKPRESRKRHKFKGLGLLTSDGVKSLFLISERINDKLFALSHKKEKMWPLLPPGYAKELNW